MERRACSLSALQLAVKQHSEVRKAGMGDQKSFSCQYWNTIACQQAVHISFIKMASSIVSIQMSIGIQSHDCLSRVENHTIQHQSLRQSGKPYSHSWPCIKIKLKHRRTHDFAHSDLLLHIHGCSHYQNGETLT